MSRLLVKSYTLFQHIPRTGGTWVSKVIDQLGIQFNRWVSKCPDRLPKKHALFGHYYHESRCRIKQSFAFVRDPVTYYRSVWSWLRDAGYRGRKRMLRKFDWHPHLTATRYWSEDFNVWTRRVIDNEPRWAGQIYDLYVGPQGGETCRFIGRTESLWQDLVFILNEIGYVDQAQELEKMEIQRANVSSSHIDIDPATAEGIRRSEASTIARFYGGDRDRRIYAVSQRETACPAF